MHTSIKFDKLRGLPDDQQIKMLAGAIGWEFSKVPLALAMSPMAGVDPARVKGVSGAGRAPSFDAIKAHMKAFLGQKYATSDDTPYLNDVSNQMEQWFHTNMPEMDMAFALLFDFLDLRNSTHDHFDILDTNAGLTWTQRRPGQAANIRRNISEAKASVSYLEWSDGLGLLDAWLQFQQYWNIDEAVMEFMTTFYDKMASLHYGLFTALGAGVDQAFATDDVQTANNAAAAIIRAVKEKGYAVGDNPTFYALCAVEQVGRLERMLTAQRGSAIVDQGTVSQPLAHRIGGIIGTTHVSASDTGWYLVLPGRKIKRGVWKDLTTETDRNIYVSATDIVGVGQYNAAIGDTDQVKRCKFS
ncbi:hypothetical protein [Thioalbus denitrificans]|uniref:Uncharacterized protein n=1 Tax=Thioalbus denitrificans TaxID=547122 RepID=A0A369CJQ1_9GAMM|nr:hypothetical protein [Thioalbus denitrificans]RCX32074.1 hypothetical protein DFQ59_102427 [Thioalbus denitrificans]